MSRPVAANRRNRAEQMCEQEEIVLRKKREILERQQQLQATAPISIASHTPNAEEPLSPSGLPYKNTFNNDGSFLANFKKLTQAASFIEQQQTSEDCQSAAVIEEPEHDHQTGQVLSDIPNTVQELVAMVAAAGDGGEAAIEDRLRSRIKEIVPRHQLWFLFDLSSPEYRSYRHQLETARQRATASTNNTITSNGSVGVTAAPPLSVISAGTSRGTIGVNTADYGKYVNVRRGAVYMEDDDTEDSDTEYRREAKERNLKNMKNRIVCHYEDSDSSSSDNQEPHKYEGSRFNMENFPSHSMASKNDATDSAPNGPQIKKKRKSRWDIDSGKAKAAAATAEGQPQEKRSRVDRSNPQVIKLAVDSFGSADLDEEQWAKVEQQFQVKQVYNQMLAKKAEKERLERSGRFKFEYDSDEEVDGGTWEHKLRKAEMEATRSKAETLTSASNGRHHIGDYLPPEELVKFMEQHDRKRRKDDEPVTDYQDKKLTEDNKGFQMLQKLGWKDGEGLGASSSGIVNPINKSAQRGSNQGLGVNSTLSPDEDDNEYDAYRKRMMLAYRFRPNPMNNPRRAYY